MKVALPFIGRPMPEVRRIARQSFRLHPLATVGAYRRFVADGFLQATYQEERYAVLAVAGERRCLPLAARTDVGLLFACIEPSLGDNDFLRKGIGWALRSLACHAPDQVRRYVQKHAVRLSALSQKEALRRIGA